MGLNSEHSSADNLENPDLKARFGGLKSFIAHYFPAEIVWRGRQGLDDIYDISFTGQNPCQPLSVWQQLALEPSAGFWSAVTNPSVNVRFAWSSNDESLLQASAAVPLSEGLSPVEKLTKADYQNIATEFIDSLSSIDPQIRAAAIEKSGASMAFTSFVREQGLLARWEVFRVEQAISTFKNRLEAAGIDLGTVSRWIEVLRASQERSRSARVQKSSATSFSQQLYHVPQSGLADEKIPDSRAVAIKTMEYLSDSELNGLTLPLGSVMRALGNLLRDRQ